MAGDGEVARLPEATYRLQFNRQFTFAQAQEIIEYLAALGVSDVYASPLFLAGPESTHGYDVCGFDRTHPNLGTEADFAKFTESVRRAGLGLLLDMVPNHMGNSCSNQWWRDVLRNGRRSKYATFFDIDWEARPDQKVLLPVLGDRYGEVLARGDLRLEYEDGEIRLANYKFPLSAENEDELKRAAHFQERDPSSVHALKQLLQQVNDDRAKLHAVIQAQHYRLAFWRVGSHEINYRRFFDVSELVSLRVEDESVFEATHRFAFELIKSGQVTGLRIDHPDGLRDPKTYFDRLQEPFRGGLFVVAEKILSNHERLPEDWKISGTTGYDYLNYLNGLFIASENGDKFSRIYSDFTGENPAYSAVEYDAKNYVLKNLFPKEVRSLTSRLRHIADQTIEGVDFTTPELQLAVEEYIAAFPVYRTYARENSKVLPEVERRYVAEAVELAASRKQQLRPALTFLGKLLQLDFPDSAADKLRQQCIEFVLRFQQLTGPATAKGLEDTAFYRYVRFVSLNEVGGNPGAFGISVRTFHEYNQHKQQRWPHSLLATSTHDTKRGEDVRARLNVLSEIPEEWNRQVRQWSESNCRFKSNGQPRARDEYLLYQILVGSWTGDRDLDTYVQRIQNYMEKATREAKLQTSWVDPNSEYDTAIKNFVESILRAPDFRSSLHAFVNQIGFFGIINSLAQVLLKICSPGVPDFYQGTELWDFNLVDPDNRRPIDYAKRKALLSGLDTVSARELLARPENPELKLFVTRTALQYRKSHSDVFRDGAYLPLEATGSKNKHVISFAREKDGKRIVALAPRLPLTLAGGQRKLPLGPEIWGDTEIALPPGSYCDCFTGQSRRSKSVAELLADFPIALLESV